MGKISGFLETNWIGKLELAMDVLRSDAFTFLDNRNRPVHLKRNPHKIWCGGILGGHSCRPHRLASTHSCGSKASDQFLLKQWDSICFAIGTIARNS